LKLSPIFEKRFLNLDFCRRKRVICRFRPCKQQQFAATCICDRSIAPSGRRAQRPIAHKSETDSRSITKIGKRVLHDTCYIAHQFQGQRSRSQAHIVCTSHLCLFFIRETKCVVRGGRGHTVSAEPGGHTACFRLRCISSSTTWNRGCLLLSKKLSVYRHTIGISV